MKMKLLLLLNGLAFAYPQSGQGQTTPATTGNYNGNTGATAGLGNTGATAGTGANSVSQNAPPATTASTAPPGSGLVGQIVSAITTGIANSNIMVGSINLGQAINNPSLVATISNGINSLIGGPTVAVPPTTGATSATGAAGATAAPQANQASTGPVSNIATDAITSMSTNQLTQMTTNMANLLVQTGMTLAQQAPGFSQSDFEKALGAVIADPGMIMALAGGN